MHIGSFVRAEIDLEISDFVFHISLKLALLVVETRSQAEHPLSLQISRRFDFPGFSSACFDARGLDITHRRRARRPRSEHVWVDLAETPGFYKLLEESLIARKIASGWWKVLHTMAISSLDLCLGNSRFLADCARPPPRPPLRPLARTRHRFRPPT